MKNKIKFTTQPIYCCGRHFQVLCQIFSLPQIPKTIQMLTGKLQQNATLLAKQALNALNSNIECVNALAVSFADPK